MLTVRGLRRLGLGPLDLDLERGKIVALTGPSGEGKSLILRAIADLDPNGGRVSLDGQSREAMPAPEWRRRVGYLAAESGWWEDTVGPHFSDLAAARALLPRLGLGAEALDWPVERLSTGERQRLAFVRLVIQGPRVLLLDEPTSGLDQRMTASLEDMLREIACDRASVLFVTHDLDQARRLAARILKLDAGRLRQVAP